jgi:hypothetical protein
MGDQNFLHDPINLSDLEKNVITDNIAEPKQENGGQPSPSNKIEKSEQRPFVVPAPDFRRKHKDNAAPVSPNLKNRLCVKKGTEKPMFVKFL